MAKLEKCPVCQGNLTLIEKNRYGCDHCHRVWKESEEGWESEPSVVYFKKDPEIGNKYTDIIQTKDQSENK